MGTREALIPRGKAAARPPRGGAGVAASLAIHLALLAALLLIVPKPAPPPPAERHVSVEMLSPDEFRSLVGPSADSLPPPRLPEGLGLPPTPPDIISFPADLPAPPRSGETIVPERFLSAATLADPRSAEALAALPQLASDERVVQLCSIEALAQIAALDDAYDPDLVAAYSMGDITLAGSTLTAAGAAFRSGGQWYGLSFDCTLTGGLDAVSAFEFTIGEAIPHEQWASHNLAEGGAPQEGY